VTLIQRFGSALISTCSCSTAAIDLRHPYGGDQIGVATHSSIPQQLHLCCDIERSVVLISALCCVSRNPARWMMLSSISATALR
jgi:hypothetical protein